MCRQHKQLWVGLSMSQPISVRYTWRKSSLFGLVVKGFDATYFEWSRETGAYRYRRDLHGWIPLTRGIQHVAGR